MRRAVIAACAVMVAGACTLLRPLDDLDDPPTDASGGSADAGRALGQPCQVATECATGACASGSCQCPTDMVRIADLGYCIDAREVTNIEYARFAAAQPDGGVVPGHPAACAWNRSVAPKLWPLPREADNFPVVGVDWCDADAYCRWAGKRLCGGAGAALSFAAYADRTRSLWSAACAGDATYPYGPTYDPRRCNGADFGGQPRLREAPVRSCHGGVAGAFDLSGNAAEWEDACDRGVEDAPCRVRGGSYRSAAPALTCSAGDAARRDAQREDLGFRCCTR